MSKLILTKTREMAMSRVKSIPRKNLYYVELNDDMISAVVGEQVLWDENPFSINKFKAQKKEKKTITNQESPPPQETPFISAIFHYTPDNDWEYKYISIQNQETPAILFNIRRLLPSTSQKYLKRMVGRRNSVAVELSRYSEVAIRDLLRLAFYISGDGNVSLGVEQRSAMTEC